MDRSHFDGCMQYLEIAILGNHKPESNKIFYDTVLFPKYKKIPDVRFSEACKWLEENYKSFGGKLPAIPDYEEALKNTHKENFSTYTESSDPTKEEQLEVARIARSFINDFEKKYPDPKKKEKPNVYKTYRKMRDQGKVFEYGTHKWVGKKDVVGDYIDPEIKLRDDLHI